VEQGLDALAAAESADNPDLGSARRVRTQVMGMVAARRDDIIATLGALVVAVGSRGGGGDGAAGEGMAGDSVAGEHAASEPAGEVDASRPRRCW
jgi:hypothetical protein